MEQGGGAGSTPAFRGRGDRNYVNKDLLTDIHTYLKQIKDTTAQGSSAQQASYELAKDTTVPNPLVSGLNQVNGQINELIGKDNLDIIERRRLQSLIQEQNNYYREINQKKGVELPISDGDESIVTKGYIKQVLRDLVSDEWEDDDDYEKPGPSKGKPVKPEDTGAIPKKPKAASGPVKTSKPIQPRDTPLASRTRQGKKNKRQKEYREFVDKNVQDPETKEKMLEDTGKGNVFYDMWNQVQSPLGNRPSWKSSW